MKVFVIPDIHLKPSLLSHAYKLVKEGNNDTVMFLGDFVDDWGQEYNLELYNATFIAIEVFIKKFGDCRICLGNHDMSYVWECRESGYSPYARDVVVNKLSRLRSLLPPENTAFIHRIDNVLFSHAGLSRAFVIKHFSHDAHTSIDHIIDRINHMGAEELWDDDSPIWLRPKDRDEAMYPEGFIQVVGHTPVAHAEQTGPVILLDLFSMDPYGCMIGDGSFYYINTEDGRFYKV